MGIFPKPWAQRINRGLRPIPAWPVYLAGVAWIGWKFWQGLTGALGPEPINTLERAYGLFALQLLVAVIAITPLRKWTGISLIKFRRALGVTAFLVVFAHFAVWAVLDLQSLGRIGAEIVKRPYVTIGFAAFVMMMPLAITSNNTAIRKMGAAAWRKLHWLTYPAVVLGAVHYLWLVKGYPAQPFVYLAGVGLLLAARLAWPRFRAAQSA